MLAQLRQTLRALQRPARLDDDPGSAPLGIPAVDGALGGGFQRGALHEISAAGEAHLPAATGFALGVASLVISGRVRSARTRNPETDSEIVSGFRVRPFGPSRNDGFCLWIAEDMALAESGAPYGPGLDAFGLAPERLLTVAAARSHDLLWAMEEALRCRAVAAVIGELRHGAIGMVAVRRLSLAAATSGALALLLRAAPPDEASTAATRWIVAAAPSSPSSSFVIPGRGRSLRTRNPETDSERAPGFRVRPFGPSRNNGDEMADETGGYFTARLTRNRRGPLGAWTLQWSDDDERFVLAAPAQPVAAPDADRPHRKIA